MGTSSAILERQLRPLAAALPSGDRVQLVHLEAPIACEPADAVVAAVFPGGPYLRYMERRRNAVPPVPVRPPHQGRVAACNAQRRAAAPCRVTPPRSDQLAPRTAERRVSRAETSMSASTRLWGAC